MCKNSDCSASGCRSEVTSVSTQRRRAAHDRESTWKPVMRRRPQAPAPSLPPLPSSIHHNHNHHHHDHSHNRAHNHNVQFSLSKALPIIGFLLCAGSAILAYSGFKGRTNTVGIDLGTTYSVVAYRGNGVSR